MSSHTLIGIANGTNVITAIKFSENGNGWIVRGYNISAETIEVCLKPWKRFSKVELVNLAEERIVDLKPDNSGSVKVGVQAHQITSILFKS